MSTTIIGLLVIILISTVASWFFSFSKQSENPIKVMLFVLYFWVFLFIQLIVFAILYYFGLLTSLT